MLIEILIPDEIIEKLKGKDTDEGFDIISNWVLDSPLVASIITDAIFVKLAAEDYEDH